MRGVKWGYRLQTKLRAMVTLWSKLFPHNRWELTTCRSSFCGSPIGAGGIRSFSSRCIAFCSSYCIAGAPFVPRCRAEYKPFWGTHKAALELAGRLQNARMRETPLRWCLIRTPCRDPSTTRPLIPRGKPALVAQKYPGCKKMQRASARKKRPVPQHRQGRTRRASMEMTGSRRSRRRGGGAFAWAILSDGG